jgi:hypothetical protein
MGVFKEAWTRFRQAKQCQRELTRAFAENSIDFMRIDSETHEKILKEAMDTDIATVAAKWTPVVQLFKEYSQQRSLLQQQMNHWCPVNL